METSVVRVVVSSRRSGETAAMRTARADPPRADLRTLSSLEVRHIGCFPCSKALNAFPRASSETCVEARSRLSLSLSLSRFPRVALASLLLKRQKMKRAGARVDVLSLDLPPADSVVICMGFLTRGISAVSGLRDSETRSFLFF